MDADVLWLVLMGPESSSLDLYRAWDARVGYRIVYVFDTFAEQLPALRRLVGAARWDLMITSFHGAVPMLERETGRRWEAVAQGVRADRFAPIAAGETRPSPFIVSFGRRVGRRDHRGRPLPRGARPALRGQHRGRAIHPHVSSRYLYRQYAWHLCRSFFTLAWPVEETPTPLRAQARSAPVTCRWFEAAAAATTMVGETPADPVFADLFGPGAVLPLDPAPRSEDEMQEALA